MTLYNQLLLPVLLWENLNQCSEEKEFAVWSQCLEDRGIQSQKQFQQQSLLLTVIVLLITMRALYITSIHQLFKFLLGLLHIKKIFYNKKKQLSYWPWTAVCILLHGIQYRQTWHPTGSQSETQIYSLSLDLRLCLCVHYSALPHRQLQFIFTSSLLSLFIQPQGGGH